MPRVVALLRAVNVGGRSTLPMADLRRVLEALGFRRVETLLQSGNAVFTARERSARTIEARLEQALRADLGLETDVIVRTPDQWRAMVDGNPFTGVAADDPSHMLVMALKRPAESVAIAPLQRVATAGEQMHLTHDTLYLTYPGGIHRSKLTGAFIERTLGTRGTSRNWNTVLKLQAMLADR